MRSGGRKRRPGKWWMLVVGLCLCLVVLGVGFPGLLRDVAAVIAADFSRPLPDEPDGRRLLVSAAAVICYAVGFGVWGHLRRWSRTYLRKSWTLSTALVSLGLVSWGLQAPWTWGLIAAVVVLALQWFNLGGLLALQEAAETERRERIKRSQAIESAKTSARRSASGAGDRERVGRTPTREPGNEG